MVEVFFADNIDSGIFGINSGFKVKSVSVFGVGVICLKEAVSVSIRCCSAEVTSQE
jgi:hypothetical protein